MSNRFGTMGSIRGNESFVIGPDDEIVCICHGDNHRDMASRIADLLDQDCEPTLAPVPPNMISVALVLLLVMGLFLCLITGTILSNPVPQP